MNSNIVDIDAANAKAYLVDESMRRPVLVDFWADWCAPCKALLPVLEKLVAEYDGAFLLAKVNADEQQGIVGQFGIRSLPTVVIMQQGQPVDAFQGAQTESVIREKLEKYLPKPWDILLDKAQNLIAQGEYNEALPLLRQAYEDSEKRSDIALALAHVWLQINRSDEAETILSQIPMVDQDATYEQLKAQLELKQQAQKAPEIQALEQQLNEDPDNRELAYQLAVQFSQHNHYREALELLMTILQADMGFAEGAAKKAFLDILVTLGKGDPLAVEYQGRFYTLMY